VADGDSRPAPDCLERLLERFTDEDVGAVTSYGLTLPPKSLIARWFHWGMAWNNDIFSFRKQAQAYRRAVAVVCGSSTMYRTRVLRVHPIPERTKAEDTDHTWVLQEHGYRVDFAINSISFDDELETAMAEFRQWDRWYSGTYQSLAVHNKELLKAKSLFWSTIVPSTAEAIPYAVAVALVPLLFLIEAAPQTDVPLISLSHIYGAIFIDFLWTLIPTALIKPKHLLHLPQIYTFKLIGGFITTRAFIRTGIEALLGRHASWRNRWVT
jgi:cellulose synthase/poly-beta-1,6-N-acetylglucosamine synthase-like glycosyltransferase